MAFVIQVFKKLTLKLVGNYYFLLKLSTFPYRPLPMVGSASYLISLRVMLVCPALICRRLFVLVEQTEGVHWSSTYDSHLFSWHIQHLNEGSVLDLSDVTYD